MFFTIYQVTNLVNGKIYVGKHISENLEDDYFGSGNYIKNAIKFYGKENFKKDILYVFDNKDDMDSKEKEIVTADFLKRTDVYNLKIGGHGGFDHISNEEKVLSGKCGSIELQNRRKDDEFNRQYLKKVSDGVIRINRKRGQGAFKNKNHKEESKKKIGSANSIHQKGKANSQYGKLWVYNLELKQSIKIEKEQLIEYVSNNWKRGRKMKF